jgi:hypothetical protein
MLKPALSLNTLFLYFTRDMFTKPIYRRLWEIRSPFTTYKGQAYDPQLVEISSYKNLFFKRQILFYIWEVEN